MTVPSDLATAMDLAKAHDHIRVHDIGSGQTLLTAEYSAPSKAEAMAHGTNVMASGSDLDFVNSIRRATGMPPLAHEDSGRDRSTGLCVLRDTRTTCRSPSHVNAFVGGAITFEGDRNDAG